MYLLSCGKLVPVITSNKTVSVVQIIMFNCVQKPLEESQIAELFSSLKRDTYKQSFITLVFC